MQKNLTHQQDIWDAPKEHKPQPADTSIYSSTTILNADLDAVCLSVCDCAWDCVSSQWFECEWWCGDHDDEDDADAAAVDDYIDNAMQVSVHETPP